MSILKLERFDSKLEEMALQFQKAKPFPYIEIDNFLPLEMAQEFVDKFPKPSEMNEKTFQMYEKKIASTPDTEGFPDDLKKYMYALNSHEMIAFLQKLTGIEAVLPDPWFYGAGLQQTMPKGRLGIHIDFNKYEKFSIDRRLNVLVYLNKEWEPSWGGEIQLWDEKVENCMVKVPPLFNKCVIFATSDISYHGLPDPIAFPEGKTRRQINLYYYTNGRNDRAAGVDAHWTKHVKRQDNANDGWKRNMEQFFIRVTPGFVSKKIKNKMLNK